VDIPPQETHQEENTDVDEDGEMAPPTSENMTTTIAAVVTTTTRPFLISHVNTTLPPMRGAETTTARKNIPTGRTTSPATIAPGIIANQVLRNSGVFGVPSFGGGGGARPTYLCTQEVKNILFLFLVMCFGFMRSMVKKC